MGTIVAILAAAIRDDGELIDGMLALAPASADGWRPPWPAAAESGELPFTLGRLAAHLAESFAGICGCLYRADPEGMAGMSALREEVAQAGEPGVAASRNLLAKLREAANEGFRRLDDDALARTIPSVFAPDGEPMLALLLVNRKHLNHHAHQLFLYLKLLGVPAGTRHLYRFASRRSGEA